MITKPNKTSLIKVIDALLSESTPLTTNDLFMNLQEIKPRTMRRRLALLVEKEAITMEKRGRGYTKGVTHVIETTDRARLEEIRAEHGVESTKA